tara:strand:+ start:2179 stop:2700 length:522 start_codon:yes stop_codon:yes gene_type:complete
MIKFMLKQLSKVRIVFLFATIISVFGVSSCYTKFEQISLGSTKFSSVSDNGTVIHIESQGSGMNTKTRKFNANANALKTIVLYGLPGSQICEYPLASSDKQGQAAKEIEKLMESGEYARFINYIVDSSFNSTIANPTNRGLTNKKQSSFKIGINFTLLRRHFEESGAIRKFGL